MKFCRGRETLPFAVACRVIAAGAAAVYLSVSSRHGYDSQKWIQNKWLGWEKVLCLRLHGGGSLKVLLVSDGKINSKTKEQLWQKLECTQDPRARFF